MSFRIACFRNDEGRIRIGDADNQVVTARQSCQCVLQMPTAKRLEASMYHAIACLHARFIAGFTSFPSPSGRKRKELAQCGRSALPYVLCKGSVCLFIRTWRTFLRPHGNRRRLRLRRHRRDRHRLLHFKY